jgi:hypothetical protein
MSGAVRSVQGAGEGGRRGTFEVAQLIRVEGMELKNRCHNDAGRPKRLHVAVR